jgi:hypothetical protein
MADIRRKTEKDDLIIEYISYELKLNIKDKSIKN